MCRISYLRGGFMNTVNIGLTFTVMMAALGLVACSGNSNKSPDVSDNIQKTLKQQNLKNISVNDDRDRGVVTLTGSVASSDQKGQAESIAKSMSAGQVVADEIAVLPPDNVHEAKTVQSDLDKGIDQNVDAALIQNGVNNGVKHKVKNGVVTLEGNVNSPSARQQAQNVAAAVPNVQQVINDLQVKNQKATASN
jgi:hyperosmotically inducible periplasmic protein